MATILSGLQAEANDISENITSILENTAQLTRSAQIDAETIFPYTNIGTDTLTDTTGYNNTIDTGNSTAIFNDVKKWAGSGIDFTSEGSAGTATSVLVYSDDIVNSPSRGYMEDVGTPTSHDSEATEDTQAVDGAATEVIKYVTFSSQQITLINFDAKSSSSGAGRVITVFAFDGSDWFFVGDTASVSSTYASFSIKLNFTCEALSFCYGNASLPSSTSGFVKNYESFQADAFEQPKVVQTNSKTFGFNVGSIQLNAATTEPAGTSVTVDISTDGGSVFEKTAQALDSVIALDGDNTGVVLKFNLNGTTSATPILHDYSYQTWS